MSRSKPRRRANSHSTAAENERSVFVFDRASIREVDRLAMREFAIPGIVLMENAARHAADVALELVEGIPRPTVTILCGGGNNGGDGFAVARHLANAGLSVRLGLLTPISKLRGDALVNATIARRMKIPMAALLALSPSSSRAASRSASSHGASVAQLTKGTHLIVDALFGTGLDRPLAGAALSTVRAINAIAQRRSVPVLALDLPSGLDADAGIALGDAVRADVTVTFAGLKRGFLNASAWPMLGEVVVADIGVPRQLLERLGTRVSLGAA